MRRVFYIAITLAGSTLAALAFETPATVTIPAGTFIYGSDQNEREYGYRLDEKAYGHSVTRKNGWYDGEPNRQTLYLPAFAITRTLITSAQYEIFLSETKHRRPFVGKKLWDSYGLVHPYSRAAKFNWTSRKAPAKRKDHPVVLVSFDDAVTFAAWLSRKTGQNWQLPSPKQWQKAARGTDGRIFPWGNIYDSTKLNSHDAGPFFTQSVQAHTNGASPYGVLDMAGQVFEWTQVPLSKPSATEQSALKRQFVVGGSWDDKGCGVCRVAARHTRPVGLKHILVGFRLVRKTSKNNHQ